MSKRPCEVICISIRKVGEIETAYFARGCRTSLAIAQLRQKTGVKTGVPLSYVKRVGEESQ